jgi:hypothetical protein
MNPDSLFQRFGGLELPVEEDDVTDGLRVLDPARNVLIELFRSAINSELSEAWTKATTGTILAGTSPVEDVLEMHSGEIKERKGAFPLLMLYRDGTGTYEQHTLFDDRLVQQWQLHYILGPLDIELVRKVGDACIAAAKIVRMVIRDRGHRSYENGAVQFGDGKGSLSSIELKSQEGPGQASFIGSDDSPLYYAISLTLETTELTGDNLEAFPTFEGASFEIGVGGGEGTIPGLIYADTDAIV